MKRYVTGLMAWMVLSLLAPGYNSAECIQGDCNNGSGMFKGTNYYYSGGFKDGMFHGAGTTTFDDGTKYNGEFAAGLYQGKGTYIRPNGE